MERLSLFVGQWPPTLAIFGRIFAADDQARTAVRAVGRDAVRRPTFRNPLTEGC